MSNNSKIVLGIVAGLCVLCLCAAGVGIAAMGVAGRAVARGVTIEERQIGKIAGGIADYDLPAGFAQQFALNTFGFSMVALAGSDGHSHIFMMQMPAGTDSAHTDLNRLLSTAVQSNGNGFQHSRVEWREVGQAQVTIRGQQVTMYINEGLNHDRDPYRQMMGVFQGRSGQTLLSIERPVANWNQAEIDNFIQSIK